LGRKIRSIFRFFFKKKFSLLLLQRPSFFFFVSRPIILFVLYFSIKGAFLFAGRKLWSDEPGRLFANRFCSCGLVPADLIPNRTALRCMIYMKRFCDVRVMEMW